MYARLTFTSTAPLARHAQDAQVETITLDALRVGGGRMENSAEAADKVEIIDDDGNVLKVLKDRNGPVT
jgi:hypothetical protein